MFYFSKIELLICHNDDDIASAPEYKFFDIKKICLIEIFMIVKLFQ